MRSVAVRSTLSRAVPTVAGRAAAGRVFAVLMAVLWAWTVTAGQVHDLLVQHVVCPEHHEVLEVHRTEAGVARDNQPDAYVGSHPSAHDHGCNVQLLPSLTAPPAPGIARSALRVRAVAEPIPVAEPARRPPLEYAPKISPPIDA